MTTLQSLTQLHKALASRARLRIVAMLRGGELCACQIAAVLDLAPSTVSRHVAELRNAGIVTERKEGRWVHFALAKDADPEVLLGLRPEHLAADPQLQADADVVERLRTIPVQVLCDAGRDIDRLVGTGQDVSNHG
jgi:DNA-binding transcriptional ArsR family regulator